MDCDASWYCMFCLKVITSAYAHKRLGSACQGSFCLKDTALNTAFLEKLVIYLVHWYNFAFDELNIKLNTY